MPNQIDLFKWSIPFLLDKVVDIIRVINTRSGKGTPTPKSEEINNADFTLIVKSTCPTLIKEQRKFRILKKKLLAVSRFGRILFLLR